MIGAEVMEVGTRTSKEGKERPFFKVLVREPGGHTELMTISGNTVELGKKYDMQIRVGAFRDALFFVLRSANISGMATPLPAKEKKF